VNGSVGSFVQTFAAAAVVGLPGGFVVLLAVTRSMTGSLEALREAMERVRDGHLDVRADVGVAARRARGDGAGAQPHGGGAAGVAGAPAGLPGRPGTAGSGAHPGAARSPGPAGAGGKAVRGEPAGGRGCARAQQPPDLRPRLRAAAGVRPRAPRSPPCLRGHRGAGGGSGPPDRPHSSPSPARSRRSGRWWTSTRWCTPP